MLDSVEGGAAAALAWRLLATLEGGSLLLVTSALLAYAAHSRVAQRKHRRAINTVLLTNTTSELGVELKRRLELNGCTVSSATSGATSEAGAVATVDALVIVGAKPKASDLNGISDVVTEDVYSNLKLLESLSTRVKSGGCIAWACEGAEAGVGPFSDTTAAFDTVLLASLQHFSKISCCEPIWVGRCNGTKQTAERIVAALFSPNTLLNTHRFSLRNAALKVGEYLYRWLKTIA